MRRDCSIGVSAETFSTADATSPTGLKPSRGREEQNVALALVVAFLVIMLLELVERFPQRTFPEQNQMGQALLFNRSHPALRKSIQIRAARRKSQTLHARYCQGLPELSAVLGIAIVQHVATAVEMSHPLQCRVASHLTHPACLRMIGDASKGDPPAVQMNEK